MRSRVGTRQQIKVTIITVLTCVTYKDCSGWFIIIVYWSHRKIIHKVYSVCSTAGCSLFTAECIITFKVHIYIFDFRSILKRWGGGLNLHKCFCHHFECINIMSIFATTNKLGQHRHHHPPFLADVFHVVFASRVFSTFAVF